MAREKELRKKLGIRIVQCPPPEALLERLLKTFRQIQSFKDCDISTYLTKTPSRSSRLLYRNETVARAKRIATTAKRILKERIVSEMESRLRLEELVLTGFRLEIDCPNEICRKRIWRLEIEVLVEKPGTIAGNLVERREKRFPCLCQSERKAFDISTLELKKIFSSRADELTQYDPFSVESEDKLETSSIRRRRPDRLVGFQQTENFDHRLSEDCQRRATPKHPVRSGKPKAPSAHEALKGVAKKSAIQHPSQQLPGRSSSELEAATTASILAGYQEFLAKNPSLLVPQSANPGIHPAAEPSELPNYFSSHPNPRQDLPHADPVVPKLSTIPALDSQPQNTSCSAETTPVPPLTRSISPEPSILSSPSTPRTRSAAPSPPPVSAHNKSSGASKRPLILEDDLETSRIRKRLKPCADLVDTEVIIID